MDKRPTVDIELPITKKKVVIKEYLTRSEERQIKNMMMGDVKFKYRGKQAESTEILASKSDLSEDKTIELMVVSVDGETDHSVFMPLLLEELPGKDFNFLRKRIDDLTKDEDEDNEKK